MTDKKPAPTDSKEDVAIVAELIRRLRLVWLLLTDGRIPIWIKSVLPLSLLYLISPVDFIPGAVFPIVGGLDDLGVILLGTALFVKLCPPEIVQSYLHELEYGDLYSDEAVDASYQVLDED